jgi:hypothetical protein
MAFRIARLALDRRLGPLVRRHLSRPFGGGAPRRAALYYHPGRISFSQAYPFLHHARGFRDRFGVQIRAIPIEPLLAGAPPAHGGADVILVQPWFTADPAALVALLGRLRDASPGAAISFLDSYAHNDLRLGRHIAPFLRHYVKKSLFRDRGLYLRAWRGDTNLTEYYGALCGLEAGPVDWQTPPDLLDRLRLGPNFLTDPRFIADFSGDGPPPRAGRTIDLHARLGRRGSGWYGAMRGAAAAALDPLSDLRVASEGHVPLKEFMRELSASKLCFSPFGYGELCWRDLEAIAAGSVLVKPDMSHLETLPDLYEPGVTYLPCRWDFADLEEVVRGALADEARSAAIAAEAWRRAADYLRGARFVEDMGFLFAEG